MMFVIMAYDVGEKRISKVRKTAKKYLCPIQRSVFQGFLTQRQLHKLKLELKNVINPEIDKIVIYKSSNEAMLEMDEIGLADSREMIL